MYWNSFVHSCKRTINANYSVHHRDHVAIHFTLPYVRGIIKSSKCLGNNFSPQTRIQRKSFVQSKKTMNECYTHFQQRSWCNKFSIAYSNNYMAIRIYCARIESDNSIDRRIDKSVINNFQLSYKVLKISTIVLNCLWLVV